MCRRLQIFFALAAILQLAASVHAQPPTPSLAAEKRVILTPTAPKEPRINGAKVYGVRPGKPLLFRIPATGERPMRYAVRDLPGGLSLDPLTGIISGRISSRQQNTYRATLVAENRLGRAEGEFRIVVGDTLALTPPMGWNTCYTRCDGITEADVRAAADSMIRSGMADYGYQYIHQDDCWTKKHGDEPYRDADGAALPRGAFPDIKDMVDHIHTLGLKAGIYTSPGPWTCGGYVGSYGHEAADVRKFAEWGFDFLKLDMCSYSELFLKDDRTLEKVQKPAKLFGRLLQEQDRDIVFNLCGFDDPWQWGWQLGAQSWRTTCDLGPVMSQRPPGFFEIGLKNARHWEYARPGRWNDPDYVIIGWVGDTFMTSATRTVPTTLTSNEQYSYMSMWSLMAAPLFFGGDMTKLDDFTLNILCNAEVIEVDQDPLGRQAKPLAPTADTAILFKPMEDGSLAVGMFNRGPADRTIAVNWNELGITGPQRIRDLWRQQDLGTIEGTFAAPIGRHGVRMIRLWPKG